MHLVKECIPKIGKLRRYHFVWGWVRGVQSFHLKQQTLEVEWSPVCRVFPELAPKPVQSIRCDVSVFVVSSCCTRNRVDRRLLVEECIAKIAKLRNLLSKCVGQCISF